MPAILVRLRASGFWKRTTYRTITEARRLITRNRAVIRRVRSARPIWRKNARCSSLSNVRLRSLIGWPRGTRSIPFGYFATTGGTDCWTASRVSESSSPASASSVSSRAHSVWGESISSNGMRTLRSWA